MVTAPSAMNRALAWATSFRGDLSLTTGNGQAGNTSTTHGGPRPLDQQHQARLQPRPEPGPARQLLPTDAVSNWYVSGKKPGPSQRSARPQHWCAEPSWVPAWHLQARPALEAASCPRGPGPQGEAAPTRMGPQGWTAGQTPATFGSKRKA